MKVKSLALQDYKRYGSRQNIDFFDKETGLIRNINIIVGNNGSGKSTILQAIASVLGTAVGKLKKPSRLDWPGYNYHLLNSGRNIEAKLTMVFDEEEIVATRDFHSQLNRRGLVGNTPEVGLSLEYLKDKIFVADIAQYDQFKGRFFASEIRKLDKDAWGNFDKIGTVMWYPERRTSTSLSGDNGESGQKFTEEMLRQRMADLYAFHNRRLKLRQGQRDVFDTIQRSYQATFLNKEMRGPDPNYRTDFDKPPYFFFFDRHHNKSYELSEMSGGERAIFPILLDFAFWKINKSVILIDELELHLHPPLQQSFVASLQSLGIDNQFIFTTHSDHIAALFPDTNVIRLD